MNIGIDARFYSEAGGLGRYVKELIKELEKQDSGNFYHIFLNQEGFKEYNPINPYFKKILADVKWYTLAEQIKMKKIIAAQPIDLMHFPHWNIPFFYRRPFVITIHDLILLKFPSRRASTLGPLKYWIKNLAYRLILKHAIRSSKKIFAPSNFVKEDILNNFKVPAKKIIITHEGLTVLPPPNPDTAAAILQKFSLQKPYFLYVGVSYPHKNLEKLILGFKKFQEQEKKSQLVLVGKKNYFYEKLEKFSEQNKVPNVIFTDFVTNDELATLYQNAKAYVFPSLCEGFGLPPLEAMSFNLPIASSNTSCLPEILGNAALYFNPVSSADITEALKRLTTDEKLRQKLISAGQERIKFFSWQNCAQLTLQEYLK
ncbi:MAG: glycosyl transferase, group 1 [Candidatus Magasanikbacteria bacterium GW2011_GWC2_40_17]|uniref:Glycosyl transferase, group 1 n=1 Tax=Candidatus Magasanikbacteria bacterium GW2011_GWA2_42_32 TaxID=1619039 RepID=A0A0G1A8D2_9BACT|nr:MAG: glycosyl transferase, group 1 [Candidatus Magasanikbacteria bacterium GW2011_GWC2_40_17]KKS57290.1 MAG: glycosyl transferase, group 1 [Candidatus Magasanikbacteria bacterium GW2011_GWA2_42_32]OGH86176.1 MAG: hypothetical protein A2294_02910 [Candidatus Magasanikbacteria bacterium RIFOXYB2_FULL_38_10]